MLINARGIKKLRRAKTCSYCNCRIETGKPAVRLFGMAERSDPPYPIHFHIYCLERGRPNLSNAEEDAICVALSPDKRKRI